MRRVPIQLVRPGSLWLFSSRPWSSTRLQGDKDTVKFESLEIYFNRFFQEPFLSTFIVQENPFIEVLFPPVEEWYLS